MSPHPTPPHDDDLLQRLRSGDEAAFSTLVQTHHTGLLALARALTHNRATAEEVVQDTWIAVIHGLDRFEGRSSLKTWIFRILTYQARRRAARERRTINWSALVNDEAESPTPDLHRFTSRGAWGAPPASWGRNPEERLLQRDTLRLLRSALDDLPPAQRAVVTLRDIEGWDAQEVCDALELSPGNQRVLLHRARLRLRERLDAALAEDAARPDKGAPTP